MSEPFRIEGQGIVMPGIYPNRTAVRSAAMAWLLDEGVDEWTAETLVAGHVERAWWAGSDLGFCNEDHPNAQPVTVVHAGSSDAA